MKKNNRINFIFVLLFLITAISAQINSDLYYKKINTSNNEDSIKYQLHLDIGNYWQGLNVDSAIFFHQEANKLATIHNTPKWQLRRAESERLIGHDFFLAGDYNQSVLYFNSALLLLREKMTHMKGTELKMNTEMQGRCLGNAGNVYYVQGDYATALENFFQALKINERIGNKQGQAKMLGNIGLVYYNLLKLSKALDYTNRAMLLNLETGNNIDYAANLTNLGAIHWRNKEYHKALEFYNKALELNEQSGDIYNVAANLGNLGNVYQEIGNLSKAEEYYKEAIQINTETGNIHGNALNFGGLAMVYFSLKKYEMAENYFKKAITINDKIGAKYDLQSNYNGLSNLYEAKGEYKEAFQAYKMSISLRDSIQSVENQKASVQKEMQAEFDKKELLIKANQEKREAVSKKELEKQKLQRNSFIVGFLLMLAVALVAFKSYHTKQKSNKIIQQQKKEVEDQKKVIEEKHKEITDSINYAERIQRSFLASQEMLDQNLKEHFVLYKPKDVVSGDFYWASQLEQGKFAIVTADSTGHGVPGAIMSLLNITSLERAVEVTANPAEILNITRKTIIERLKKDGSFGGGKDGMDCSIMVFNSKARSLEIAAANNPIWLIRNGEMIEIKGDKMPVGKHEMDRVGFTHHKLDISQGDIIYAITDGFPDQFGGVNGKKFMIKKLKELIVSISNKPMQEQKSILEGVFVSWAGDNEQVDDVTIIGIRV